ncbi:cysteine dioxygenase [Streptomyces sp. H10-C2]|uniref:cysteine dioxygenase n=1 Tax=unclassified Streptomyces TaxID=2593676 RepID=UPI0024BBDB56|nr:MULTISPECIES: cysteine dioxygenase [unclassified Streptomyces]MDJ0343973.1 cysteine dioxygenase [Streptomyces sp. PH10-H1]MDJ0373536.1 cysteine dioxygenase [Streptomyces sp. H10-C2]
MSAPASVFVSPAPAAPSAPAAFSEPASAPARVSAPTAAELLDFVRSIASDPEKVAQLALDPLDRSWIRLEGPGGAEAWLLGWPPGTETGWHDHGGSYGAFVTAGGELTEESLAVPLPSEGWHSLELAEGLDRTRALPAGKGRAFGRNHVHQVANRSAERHAISVHVYYPPLPLIRRYVRDGRTLRLDVVEHPETW